MITKRRTPVKHRKFEKHLIRCTNKFCNPTALDYLFAISQCTDKKRQQLDIDDGEETEDYNVDDYLHGSSQSSSNSEEVCNFVGAR